MDASSFLAAAGAVAGLVAGSELRDRWNQPSVLVGYTVGELAAHAARGVLTVENYLHSTPPDPSSERLDAIGYFVSTLADHDPVDSEFHRSVRMRAARAAEAGPDALVEAVTTARHNLLGRFGDDVDGDREVAVLGRRRMSLREYLRTRVFELAIHSDDLAASLQVPAPHLPPAVWEDVAELATGIAARRHGARVLALSLTRSERTARLSAL